MFKGYKFLGEEGRRPYEALREVRGNDQQK